MRIQSLSMLQVRRAFSCWACAISLLLLLLLSACNHSIRNCIVYSESASIGIVKNGTAYDHVVVALDGMDTIVLPSRANVLQTANGDVSIQLAKTLGFMGHPVERYSIDQVRNEMGCVSRVEGTKVYIATFGEAMTPEGGRTIALTVHIPNGVQVERSDAYEMNRKDSIASSRIRRRDSDGMFASEGSNEVWSLIRDEPDFGRFQRRILQTASNDLSARHRHIDPDRSLPQTRSSKASKERDSTSVKNFIHYQYNTGYQGDKVGREGDIQVDSTGLVTIKTTNPIKSLFQFNIDENECDDLLNYFSNDQTFRTHVNQFMISGAPTPIIFGELYGEKLLLIHSLETPIPERAHQILLNLVKRGSESSTIK